MLQSKLLANYTNLIHFFGEKADTSNLEIFTTEQIHDSKVVILKNAKNKFIKGADGMVTGQRLILGIKTADCLPILFYDPKKEIIAAIHAGWRSLYAGIISHTIKAFNKLKSEASDIKVAIGPHIGVCCYNVPLERVRKFQKLATTVEIAQLHSKSWYLDLGKIAFSQLTHLGIPPSNIEISDICTNDDKRFWSFRRDKKNTGRMMNIIGIVAN